LSLCNTAHPLQTRFANIFGASISDNATEPYAQAADEPAKRHPLGRAGGWVAEPRHHTRNQMWEQRWRAEQPDPSFDVDGDGIISCEDLLVAHEFDKASDDAIFSTTIQPP
jgi:hypothetical protein